MRFPDAKSALAIQKGITWLKLAQDQKTRLWGFTPKTEPNNASTTQAVSTLLQFGENPNDYKEALNSLLKELKENGYWKTTEECYTLKYFGEGLDNRITWFYAPLAVKLLIEYSKKLPKDVDISKIVDAVESLKKFDTKYKSFDATSINVDHDVRLWASAEFLQGLLEAQTYLQEHLDDYLHVMSTKLVIIEKAGMLKSLPIMFTLKRKTNFYASGAFLAALIPTIGITLFAAAYFASLPSFMVDIFTGEAVTSAYIAYTGILFGIYLLTLAILCISYKQKVVSRSRFAYLYFPIWSLVVLSTGLFLFDHAAEGLIVLLLIGFPEILHHIMGKAHKEEAKTKPTQP
ncbi:MAG: hypothetical protein GX638_09805 [Crenarchaeota archaeon]|nr:hypothetical protein [Thermoproteota archaeon]